MRVGAQGVETLSLRAFIRSGVEVPRTSGQIAKALADWLVERRGWERQAASKVLRGPEGILQADLANRLGNAPLVRVVVRPPAGLEGPGLLKRLTRMAPIDKRAPHLPSSEVAYAAKSQVVLGGRGDAVATARTLAKRGWQSPRYQIGSVVQINEGAWLVSAVKPQLDDWFTDVVLSGEQLLRRRADQAQPRHPGSTMVLSRVDRGLTDLVDSNGVHFDMVAKPVRKMNVRPERATWDSSPSPSGWNPTRRFAGTNASR